MMRHILLTIGILIFITPQFAHACAVCYGDPQSPMTAGLNQAILLLLGVIGFILSLVFSVGIYFVRRNKVLENTGIKK